MKVPQSGPNLTGCAVPLAFAGIGLLALSFVPYGLAWSWREMEGMGTGGTLGQLVIVAVTCSAGIVLALWVLRIAVVVLRDVFGTLRSVLAPVLGPIVLMLRFFGVMGWRMTYTARRAVQRRLDRLPYSPKGYLRLLWARVRMRPHGPQGRPQGSAAPLSPFPSGEGDAGASPGADAGPVADAGGEAPAVVPDRDLDDLGEHPDERAHLVAGVVPYGPRGGKKSRKLMASVGKRKAAAWWLPSA